MATVASIRAQYRVDTKAVNAATRKVRGELAKQRAQVRLMNRSWKTLGAGVDSYAKRIGNLRSVVGVALGGGIFGAAIKQAADFGAELVEVAGGLGDTVENVQKLQQAFASDGISNETTLKFFRNLTRAALEAERGVLTYAEAFRRLGITDVGAFSRLSATERSLALAQAGPTRSQEDLVYGFSALGARGADALKLANIFGQEGRLESNLAGIEGLARVSDEAAANLKALNQEFYNLRQNVLNTFRNAIGENSEALERFTRKLSRDLPEIIERLTPTIAAISARFDNLLSAGGTLVASGFAARGAASAARLGGSVAGLAGAAGLASALPGVGQALAGAAITVGALSVIAELVEIRGETKFQERVAGAGLTDLGNLADEVYAEILERIETLTATRSAAGRGYVSPSIEGLVEQDDHLRTLFGRYAQIVGMSADKLAIRNRKVEDAGVKQVEANKVIADASADEAAVRMMRVADLRQSIAEEAAAERVAQGLRDRAGSIAPFDYSWQPSDAGRARLVAGTRIAVGDTPRRVAEQEELYRAYEQSSVGTKALIDASYGLGGAFRGLIGRSPGDGRRSRLDGGQDTVVLRLHRRPFARFLHLSVDG